jgi:hypothetical protein
MNFFANSPDAKEQPPFKIQDAGHYLQEEKGEEIAHQIVKFISAYASQRRIMQKRFGPAWPTQTRLRAGCFSSPGMDWWSRGLCI